MLSIKPFKCDCCDKCFTEKFNLTKHKKKHSKPNSISKEEEVLSLLQQLNKKEKEVEFIKNRIALLNVDIFENR